MAPHPRAHIDPGLERVLYLLGTVHPRLGDGGGVGLEDGHAAVVELPEVLALEEVRLAVRVAEGGVDGVGDARPDGDVARVVELDVHHVLLEPPVHRVWNEMGFSDTDEVKFNLIDEHAN